MQKPVSINYLSHGFFKTGGYRYESHLAQALADYYGVSFSEKRQWRNFPSFFQHLRLLYWSFANANASVNIVVARCALPALLRNIFNGKRVYIVLHNHDDSDEKSTVLKIYFKFLFFALRFSKSPKVQLIVVANYWRDYFDNKIHSHRLSIVVYPNLFDTTFYQKHKINDKQNWIHLGQFSSKNDPEIFVLARSLSRAGYYCYFSTIDSNASRPGNGNFEIIYFLNFEDYLNQMARSLATVCFTKINEGWNRIAHESLLVGTTVMGFNRGGLGELLREAGMPHIRNSDEAISLLANGYFPQTSTDFILKFDLNRSKDYLKFLTNE